MEVLLPLTSAHGGWAVCGAQAFFSSFIFASIVSSLMPRRWGGGALYMHVQRQRCIFFLCKIGYDSKAQMAKGGTDCGDGESNTDQLTMRGVCMPGLFGLSAYESL